MSFPEYNPGTGDSTQPSQVDAQTDSSIDSAPQGEMSEQQAQAILELDKVEKFKFGGQEWTAKDLQSAIMRQKDYTQKTQALAKERESFGSEQKYYENLAYDLLKVKANPSLAQQFISTYPAKFHGYLQNMLSELQEQGQSQQQYGQRVDVQTLSRLERLEKAQMEAEVAKQEKQIESMVEKFSKQYPDAANFKELVLGRAYEANMGGAQLSEEAWENLFKTVDTEVKTMLKTKYGNMVKEQTNANQKAKDVSSGGGTIGRAPKKFTSFREINEAAFPGLTGERS